MLAKIEKMLENQPKESYSRYDSSHPLDVFLGIDQLGRKSLVIIMDAKKEKVSSSKNITVEFFKREDGKLLLRFSLEDNSFSDIFYKFCEDIIESTRNAAVGGSFVYIIERWNTWMMFFSKSFPSLSENEIIGLIGEVYFLKNVMTRKYGTNRALRSFIGVDKSHKDFEIDETWYEVKTIHNGVRSVKISSIEQLESEKVGQLEVITLDQGTSDTVGNITLNGIVADFRKTLSNQQAFEFDEKMRKANYVPDDRYDEYVYIFVRIVEYVVNDDFPKLITKKLPNGISKASYEIDISALDRLRA